MYVTVKENKPQYKRMQDMEVGEVGIIDDSTTSLNSHVVIGTYDDTVVSLTDPEHMWSQCRATLRVRILAPGSTVTLEV